MAGQAQAGYRIFKLLNQPLQEYRGFVASAGLRYQISDITRVSFNAGHDVKYSFDPVQPYYLESGLRVRLNQRVVGPFEAVAILERWQLRYQQVGGHSFDGRHEDTTIIGGGIEFRKSQQMEFTFTVDRARRTSSDPLGRNFDRRRALASISYAL